MIPVTRTNFKDWSFAFLSAPPYPSQPGMARG